MALRSMLASDWALEVDTAASGATAPQWTPVRGLSNFSESTDDNTEDDSTNDAPARCVLGLGHNRSPASHRGPHRGAARGHPPRVDLLPLARHRRGRADVADRPVEIQRRTTPASRPGTGERPGHHHQPAPKSQRRKHPVDQALRRPRAHRRSGASASVPAQAHGWKWAVPSPATIYKLLDQVLARASLATSDGEPLQYRPHDFRRMFATEAVTGGLPVHIVARLLGHANISTTEAYMAIFDEELVRSYRAFLDHRRAVRPEAEYREPTEEEWREFQQHFQLRKLELGECGRPYGTPCKHEHACIRCPSLRLDPAARRRLVEIIANLRDRIEEAKLNGWLGKSLASTRASRPQPASWSAWTECVIGSRLARSISASPSSPD